MPSTPGTINYPASLDDAISLVEVNNNASSTLNTAIDSDDLLIEVADPNEFSASGFATITDSLTAPTKTEIFIFTSKSGNNLVVPTGGRGAQNTIAQSFSPGAFVEQRITARHHTAQSDVLIALETKLGIGADTPGGSAEALISDSAGQSGWRAIAQADVTGLVAALAAAGMVNAGAAKRLAYYPGNGAAVDDAPGFEYQSGASPNVLIKAQADAHRALLIEPFSDSYSTEPFRVRNVAQTASINADPNNNLSDVLYLLSDEDFGAGFAAYVTDPIAKAYFGFGSDSAFGNLAVHGSGGGGAFLSDMPDSMSISEFNGGGGLFLTSVGPICLSTGGTFGDEIEQERMRVRATGITLYAPTSALADGSLRVSEIHPHLDEGNNKLIVKAKYSGGGVHLFPIPENGIIDAADISDFAAAVALVDLSAIYSLVGHAHAASAITSGQLALARGGTGADLSGTGAGYLKQATTGANVTVGSIAAGDLPTGIDAAKIADSSVSNTEFQYLNGVTSAIQTQLDGKASVVGVPVNIHVDTSNVGNVTTGLDSLHSFTLPAGSLANDGDYLTVLYSGTFAANDNDKRIQISFGGQVVHNTGLTDIDDFSWTYRITYTRVSSTTVRVAMTLNWGFIVRISAGTFSGHGQATSHNTLITVSDLASNAMTMLVEGEATATNDIVQNLSVIERTRIA